MCCEYGLLSWSYSQLHKLSLGTCYHQNNKTYCLCFNLIYIKIVVYISCILRCNDIKPPPLSWSVSLKSEDYFPPFWINFLNWCQLLRTLSFRFRTEVLIFLLRAVTCCVWFIYSHQGFSVSDALPTTKYECWPKYCRVNDFLSNPGNFLAAFVWLILL